VKRIVVPEHDLQYYRRYAHLPHLYVPGWAGRPLFHFELGLINRTGPACTITLLVKKKDGADSPRLDTSKIHYVL